MHTDRESLRIRELLSEEIDWTAFVKKILDHGLTSLVASTLTQTARDLVPGEILEAFDLACQRKLNTSQALLDELMRILRALEENGVQAIPFKGPILALEAYGDLRFREFGDLDFLVRDSDIDRAIQILQELGYKHKTRLADSQARLIQRIQGQDLLFLDGARVAIEPHTRLIPLKMALQIDYAALWSRARLRRWGEFETRTLAPEDGLLLLAIHGGKEFWWRMNWACDVAAFVASHPSLKWNEVIEQARSQGSQRMVLLALSLARNFFGAEVPPDIMRLEAADPVLGDMVRRIAKCWGEENTKGPPSNRKLSMDRLRLHDRFIQRASYIVRTISVPGPEIVAWVALPRFLGFAYVPLKILHDTLLLPLWRLYCAILRGGKKRL